MNTPPPPAPAWQLRSRRLKFAGSQPALMGILNVTPDSFSDGGKFYDVDRAIAQAEQLAADGAAILDIGGESTRPYSAAVSVEDELSRVVPLLEQLRDRVDIPLSIDTSKAAVAAAAIERGVEIVNDVTGLEGDPRMLEVVRDAGVGVCVMHMQGTPKTMQDDPSYDDVVEDILEYLRRRRDALTAAGISEDRICLDPGVGFGKTHAHNLELIARSDRFHELGCPLLVGHSRKGFIAHVLGDKQCDRTAGTIGAAIVLARRGVQVIRVHDVAPVRQALLLHAACGG